MPIYSYHCVDCGAEIEKLHGIGKTAELCGLDCQRRGAGSFGTGRLEPRIAAPQVIVGKGELQTGGSGASSVAMKDAIARAKLESLQQRARRKLGGDVSEKELDIAREHGMTVYRKSGRHEWTKDGGDEAAPKRLKVEDGDR
jgi:hypothetical protein